MKIPLRTAILPLALTIATPALAEGLPDKAGPERTVAMFNTFCFARMPDIESIEKIAAAGEFTELQGDDLKPYQPPVPAEKLRVWKYKDFDKEYSLTISQSLPDEEFKKAVPDFADSKSFACSLVLPATDPKEELLQGVEKVLERKPDESYEEGPFNVHTWSGLSDTLMVHVYYYAPAKGKAGGLMSTVTFVKN